MAGVSVEAKKKWAPNIKAIQRKALNVQRSNYWVPPEGTTKVRILPTWDPDSETNAFFYEQVLHYGCKDGDNKIAIPCFAYVGEECPVCTLIDWLSNNGSETQKKKIRDELTPQVSTYYNVLPRNLDPPKILVWRTGDRLRNLLIEYLSTEDYADMLDPELGRDMLLTRKGVGQGTRYPGFTPGANPTSVGLEDWSSKMHNLPLIAEKKMTQDDALGHLYSNFDGEVPMEEVFNG